MLAVVMAGGEGSRLRPLTINRPKPMVTIANKPCPGHIFDQLTRSGITDAYVTLQYLASVIQDGYGDGATAGMRLRYSIEETPLGTGGSARQIGDGLTGTFIVISGDALTDIDLTKVIAFHEEKGACVTLTLYRVPDPLEYGVVITDGDGRITKFLEKPSWGEVFSDTINTGIVEIHPSAVVTGPVYLGSGVKIAGGPQIIGPTVLRSQVAVDAGAVIDRSIVWRNTYVGERAELHGAIVGRQCALTSRAVLEEGSVSGDHSVVNEGARVCAQVKIWPDKQIEAGATVGASLIWGSQGRPALIGRFGVTGLVNVDLTPEFAARLGAAYASTPARGATVTLNRDQHRTSRMLKRSLMGGIVSAGVLVADLSQAPLPIDRFHTQLLDTLGIDSVPIRGVVSENVGARSMDDFEQQKRELGTITSTLRATCGVIIDAGGEKIFVADDRGRVINDRHFLAVYAGLAARESKDVIAVPGFAPAVVERLVTEAGGRLARVRSSAEAQMSYAAREKPLLVADGLGGFIFPAFHPWFDGLFAVVRLPELLALGGRSLSQIVDETPVPHIARLKSSARGMRRAA